MSNYCRNTLEILGPQTRQCLDAIKSKECLIDFNLIEPMPDCLRGTGITVVDEVEPEEIIATPKEKGVIKNRVYDDEHLKTNLEERCPTRAVIAARELRAKAETGYSTWEDWRKKLWGTTEPGCQSRILKQNEHHTVIEFLTTGSSPLPVVHKLSTQWTDLKFHFSYEDWDSWITGDLILRNEGVRWFQYVMEKIQENDRFRFRHGRPGFDKPIIEDYQPAERQTACVPAVGKKEGEDA